MVYIVVCENGQCCDEPKENYHQLYHYSQVYRAFEHL